MAVLAVVALVAAATLPGSHATHGRTTLARATVAARQSPANHLTRHVARVFGSSVSATKYGTVIADQEKGLSSNGQLSSDLSPLAAAQFRRPVAAYKRYAQRWAVRLGHGVAGLTRGLRAGDRRAAQRQWDACFVAYLHLGAVYGLLPGTLNARLAEVPPEIGERDFPGLHRIELGLWTGDSLRSLMPISTTLSRAVVTLRHVLPRVVIDPLDYATRTHEILEDAQRDLMGGDDVPWSGQGVLGTAAGVAVTRRMIATLVPLLRGRDDTLAESQNWLAELQRALEQVRRPDGSYPALTQLTAGQRERIDGTLAGTLGALELIPGSLETTRIPEIPSIPHPSATPHLTGATS